MIRRLLLVPTDEGDPHRLLIGCARMQLTMSIGSPMERLKRRAATPRWVDVDDATDWRGTQGRVLLDLPPMSASRWRYWVRSAVGILRSSLSNLGLAFGEWRVVAVDADGREVEL